MSRLHSSLCKKIRTARRSPEAGWVEVMAASSVVEEKLIAVEQAVSSAGKEVDVLLVVAWSSV